MPVSVNQTLANSQRLIDPAGRMPDYGRGSYGKADIAGRPLRYAYNMDGIDDRWALANRAINPDGDIDIEFYTPSSVATGAFRSIVSQCNSSTTTLREFDLFISGASGNIGLTLGGTASAIALAGTFTASTKYRLTLIGNQSTIYDSSGNIIRSATIPRGAAREPTALTTIGARFGGSGYSDFFTGIQRDIKINGTLWPIGDRNQAIQPSIPAGNNMTGTNLNPDRWVEIPV